MLIQAATSSGSQHPTPRPEGESTRALDVNLITPTETTSTTALLRTALPALRHWFGPPRSGATTGQPAKEKSWTRM
jgi:hypothetical protein